MTDTISLNVNKAPRKRADAVANRKLILETAESLFREHGVENVTMSQIAAAAGVGKGTLYRAVANKGDLCLALMDSDMRRFQDHTFAHLNEIVEQSAVARLEWFLDAMIRFFDLHAPMMLEAVGHGLDLSVRSALSPNSLHGWFHTTVSLLVRQAQEEGAVSAESDPAHLADLILAPLNPRLFVHQRTAVGLSLDQISTQLRAFVLHGIQVG